MCCHYFHFIADCNGCQNKYVMIQYWFDGPVINKKKPHGNSSTSNPFFRIAESEKAEHRQVAAQNTPKSAVQVATSQQGGEIQACGFSKLPRNVQEMKNYCRTGKKHHSDVLYSVMLQYKLAKGKREAFVCDVEVAPEPQCVLFFDWQLNDLAHFVIKPDQFVC